MGEIISEEVFNILTRLCINVYNTILQLGKCIQFGKICENEGELKNPFKITLPSCANVKKTSVRQAKNVKRD